MYFKCLAIDYDVIKIKLRRCCVSSRPRWTPWSVGRLLVLLKYCFTSAYNGLGMELYEFWTGSWSVNCTSSWRPLALPASLSSTAKAGDSFLRITSAILCWSEERSSRSIRGSMGFVEVLICLTSGVGSAADLPSGLVSNSGGTSSNIVRTSSSLPKVVRLWRTVSRSVLFAIGILTRQDLPVDRVRRVSATSRPSGQVCSSSEVKRVVSGSVTGPAWIQQAMKESCPFWYYNISFPYFNCAEVFRIISFDHGKDGVDGRWRQHCEGASNYWWW